MIENSLKIKGIKFKNRLVVSPMCQYSAKNGNPTKWHYNHLRNLIETGAGCLVIESTAINKFGRITEKDLCLYNQTHYLKHKELIKYLKKINNIPIILQLSHSGRKGSAETPWVKKNTPLKSKKRKWKTLAPSSIQRSKNWPTPKEMRKKDIVKVISDFKNSSKLAFKAGYDGVEIHMAHGYLLHEFGSPISNKRKDEYGLSSNDKYKLQQQIIESISKIKKRNKIIGAKVTGDDHLKKGIKPNNCVELINKLKLKGLNYACISSGGIIPITKMKKNKTAFRLKMAKYIKKKTNLLIRTSGNLNSKKILLNSIRKKDVDLIAIGREFIKNKYFLYQFKNLNLKKISQYK